MRGQRAGAVGIVRLKEKWRKNKEEEKVCQLACPSVCNTFLGGFNAKLSLLPLLTDAIIDTASVFYIHFHQNVVYDLGKKHGSPSGGHISVNSQPIIKTDMGFGIANKFPTIWEFAQLCSFICLEVIIKNIKCVSF